MANGTVKWFNSVKGFGFIAPENGGNDIFVHVTALQDTGLTTLQDGQRVSFEITTQKDGRAAAANIQLLDAA